MVICLQLGADLHMAQLMPLPLTVSCFNKIQICFTFLVPADLGIPGKRAVKRVLFFGSFWSQQLFHQSTVNGQKHVRYQLTISCCDVSYRKLTFYAICLQSYFFVIRRTETEMNAISIHRVQ